MIDPSTRNTIDSWMYGGTPAAVAAPQPRAAATGMLAAAAPATSQSPTDAYTSQLYAPQPVEQVGKTTPHWANLSANTIAPTDLTQRTVDARTETVNGQMQSLMSQNSGLLQQAKSDAMRTANERGMLNSSMAASAGTDAMLRSALQVATPDATQYAHAADYNAAAENQAVMYNADQRNQTDRLQAQMRAEAEAQTQTQAQQKYLAEMQDATSRYNTDANYRQQADANKKSLVNNILQNMEFSPDRKAAMLEQMGEGTSAGTNADGSYRPGTGLAGAVWVIDSIAADLNTTAAARSTTGVRSTASVATPSSGASGMIGRASQSAYNMAMR